MVPGAVVFLRTPQGTFTAASGTTELGKTIPPDANTHFRIASNTKTMTAALIMLLMQDGKLSLEDKVSKYVPNVPNGDKITVAQLLEMRSGLYNYTNDPKLAAAMDSDQARVWTPQEMLEMAFAHPLNAEPDQEFEYNNTNYALLGLIVEKAGGKPLQQAMQDWLFTPLGLKNTVLPASDDNTIPEPYTRGYLYGSSSVALVGDTPYTPEVIAAAKAGTLLPTDFTGVNHSFAAAAGGALSTASDLATWTKSLVGGGLFNAETQKIWLDSLKLEDPDQPQGQKYGYGIAYFAWGDNSIYFHGGETPGYNSKISYDPANDVSLIVWTNLAVSLDEQQTANTLWVRVLDQIYKQSPLTPASPPASQPVNPDTGVDVTALEPGLKTIDQAALQTMVNSTTQALLVPGAVVVLRTPQGDFTVSSGVTAIGATTPPGADTYFRIASNTKTMTAALIMLLAQEGKLSLDDVVSRYIADVPNGDKITIGQLLEMRSGLYNYTNDPKLSADMDRDPAKVWPPQEMLALAFAHPLNAEPDQEYEYNNTNYVLLGLIVEKVDGKSLAQSMQDRLFGPLKLAHTSLPAADVNTLPEPYSRGYLFGSASNAMFGEPLYTPEDLAAFEAGTLKPTDFTNLNHSWAWATGNAISTADDLAVWIKALTGGDVFNAETHQIWLNSLKPENPDQPEGQQYGYGISKFSWGGNSIYFHGGETAGFNSKISYDPANDVTLIVWTNLTLGLNNQQTANTLFLNVLDQIYKVSPLTPPAPKAP